MAGSIPSVMTKLTTWRLSHFPGRPVLVVEIRGHLLRDQQRRHRLDTERAPAKPDRGIGKLDKIANPGLASTTMVPTITWKRS